MEYVAEPLNRSQLRDLARQLRDLLGINNSLYFPVMPFFERIMPQLFEGFHYEIVSKEEFSESKHADTDVANRCIRIREDVYYRAAAGEGRDRMTVISKKSR